MSEADSTALPIAVAAPSSAAPRRAVKSKPKSRRWLKWAVALVVVGGLSGGGVYAYRHYQTQQAAAAAPVVKTATVAKGDVERHIESSGKVVSNLDVDIKCRASGTIVELPFDISDSVKAGDVLCKLDPTDEELAVKLAQATVDQATARVAQAQADLKQAQQAIITTRSRNEATLTAAKVSAANATAKAGRQKQLVDQQLGSQEEYETALTEEAAAINAEKTAEVAIEELKQQETAIDSKAQDVKLAEAQLAADKIQFDTQNQNLGYTTVTAPMDGVVSAMTVQKGVIVASGTSNVSGGTTILTLSDLSHVFVTATVDESDIGGVKVGQKSTISVDSFPNRRFVGKVVRVAVKGVNASNVVTFEVKVEVLDEKKNLLKPEMTGNITIVQDERHDVLTLPPEAVTRQGERGAYVMIAGANGAVAEKRPVKVGLAGTEAVEIVDGLKEGDQVIVNTDDANSKFKAGGQGGPGGGGQRRGGPPRIL